MLQGGSGFEASSAGKDGEITFGQLPVAAGPKPAIWLLLATGLAGLLAYGWRQRRGAA